MQCLAAIILLFSYDLCMGDDLSFESEIIRLTNQDRLNVKIRGVPLNNKTLERNGTLTAEAKRLADSCQSPKHAAHYRFIFFVPLPEHPIYKSTQELVWQGKIEEALKLVNSYSYPVPNFLEELVPTQEIIGCARSRCEYDFKGIKFRSFAICCIGPKRKISLSDFFPEPSTTSTTTEATTTLTTTTEATTTSTMTTTTILPTTAEPTSTRTTSTSTTSTSTTSTSTTSTSTTSTEATSTELVSTTELTTSSKRSTTTEDSSSSQAATKANVTVAPLNIEGHAQKTTETPKDQNDAMNFSVYFIFYVTLIFFYQ
uniref:Uncharacterized protein n=1 Tax=Caenorhabditis japonica TaxID=281687 RepID=A0A8R1IBD7_CAEJA